MKTILILFTGLFLTSGIAVGQDVLLIMGPDLQSEDVAYNAIKVDSNSEIGNISGQHISHYANGFVESKGTFYKGQKNGLWMSWSEDGAPLNQAYYTHGQKDGTWKVWDEKGTLRYLMYYKNGERTKTWQVFDESGQLVEEKQY